MNVQYKDNLPLNTIVESIVDKNIYICKNRFISSFVHYLENGGSILSKKKLFTINILSNFLLKTAHYMAPFLPRGSLKIFPTLLFKGIELR